MTAVRMSREVVTNMHFSISQNLWKQFAKQSYLLCNYVTDSPLLLLPHQWKKCVVFALFFRGCHDVPHSIERLSATQRVTGAVTCSLVIHGPVCPVHHSGEIISKWCFQFEVYNADIPVLSCSTKGVCNPVFRNLSIVPYMSCYVHDRYLPNRPENDWAESNHLGLAEGIDVWWPCSTWLLKSVLSLAAAPIIYFLKW